jgi:hypothetical protein
MPTRQVAPFALVALALGLSACGGGDGGGSTLAVGEEAVVEHTESGKADGARTTLGITVLTVRKGTQAELEQAGFTLDPVEKTATPYYVDTRFENQGQQAMPLPLFVSLEDGDGNSISSTTVIEFGGPPFEKCPQRDEEELAPGASHESCLLFLVPEGREASRVSFLPYDPEEPTDFVYWEVG